MPTFSELPLLQQVTLSTIAQDHGLDASPYVCDHADEVIWLSQAENRGRSNFLNSLWRSLLRYDRLTDAQTAAVQNNMRQRGINIGETSLGTNPPAQPATAHEVPEIYNGTYEVGVPGYATRSFQIYTVTRGTLQGKRIIKQRVGGSFSGFAFLMNDGSFKLWRRFEDQSTEVFVQIAEQLIPSLKQRADAGGLPTTGEGYHDTFDIEGAHMYVNIVGTYACRVCNGSTTFGIHAACDRPDPAPQVRPTVQRPTATTPRTPQRSSLDESSLPRSAINPTMIL